MQSTENREMKDNSISQKAKLLRSQAGISIKNNDIERAHKLLALAKSLRIPLENIDYLRAIIFIRRGQPADAREALKEELRYFPSNIAAKKLLNDLDYREICIANASDEFYKIYKKILPYTMVGPLRLHALYENAIRICQNGPAGNFVECGVAAGGTSGLLSYVLKVYGNNRKLFACDSFSGMPPAGKEDISNSGESAQSTGWGEGTCAAPEESVLGLSSELGTRELITPIKGYFEQTLPQFAAIFAPIAYLHMDGDWYSSTKAILENLYPHIVKGGYIQIDDYGYWKGCRKAVDEFFDKKNIKLDASLIEGCAISFTK